MLVKSVLSGVIAEVSDDAKDELGFEWVPVSETGETPKRQRNTAAKGE